MNHRLLNTILTKEYTIITVRLLHSGSYSITYRASNVHQFAATIDKTWAIHHIYDNHLAMTLINHITYDVDKK